MKSKGKSAKKLYIYVLPNELESYSANMRQIARRTNLTPEIFSVADKARHDPENKSKKVKPGKPGIYME